MNAKQPLYKKWWVWLISIAVLLFLTFGIPLIINNCYIENKGYITVWAGADVFQFYGSILSFLGTVSLGILALWQNHVLAKQNDKYRNILERKDLPIFQIELESFQTLLSNPTLKIINLTNNIATNFTISEFEVKNPDNGKIFRSYKAEIKFPICFGGKQEYRLNFSDMDGDINNTSFNSNYEISFRYTDVYSNEHQCIAIRKINNFCGPMIVHEMK